ncbi:calphotin-like isoform X2 [Dermacentor albipictus]|uniref:calphotin-like isoform X2 n=1 Tax=Dermacentor albipictus TaxID=60249 RepID=UPI0031FE0978
MSLFTLLSLQSCRSCYCCRLPLLLSAIAGALATPEGVSYAFTGYSNVLGGGLAVPGASNYEPLQTAAAEPLQQKVATERTTSSVDVIEKPSRLRLARPPAVTVLPNAAAPGTQAAGAVPGTATFTTYPANVPPVTFQRPLYYAASPPAVQYVATAPQHQIFFSRPGVGVAAQTPATATGTAAAASAAGVGSAAAKANTVTVTSNGAAVGTTVGSAGAAVVTSNKPAAVTVSRPVAVTYPPPQTYLFQRPAYAYQRAAVAPVQAPVQLTYMRPLYQPASYGLQPAAVAPAVNPVYQRPLVAYQHGAPAAPLTIAYPGALRTLTGAPAVYAAPPVAMPLAAAAPLVSAVPAAAAPVAAMPHYAFARQVIAPFPGSVALARPQLGYQTAAYAHPAYGMAFGYAPAAVQPMHFFRQAKSKK